MDARVCTSLKLLPGPAAAAKSISFFGLDTWWDYQGHKSLIQSQLNELANAMAYAQ